MTFAEEMSSLLLATVRRSFDRLVEGPPPFPEHAVDLAESCGKRLAPIFRHNSLTPDPVFIKTSQDERTYTCLQKEFFGFYLFREALRWPLSAVNFQVAGSATLERELYAPATALFYTAAYHALHAYLALNGRVILDQEAFRWIGGDDGPSALAACLTRKGEWLVEPRSRDHRSKWLELERILGRRGFRIPRYFHRFFRQLFPGLKKPGYSTIDVIRDPKGSRAELEDNLSRFLRRIPDVRHIALYQGRGEDPFVVDALLNREQFDRSGIEGQAEAVGLFSQCLLTDSVAMVRKLLASAERLRPAHKLILVLGAHFPWADEPRFDKWSDRSFRSEFEAVWSWVQDLPKEAGEDLAAVGR